MRRFSFVSVLLLVALVGCTKTQTESAQPADVNNSGGDPANGNLASADQSVAAEPQAPAPAPQYTPEYTQDSSYNQPVEASEPPPPLPEYDQPPAPGDDYIWTPGYWGYASSGYYWVPGAWIVAPYVGALWTPPWWGYDSGAYHWHGGYWGPHIGYYGGIDYGNGYTGRGYYGAYWNNGRVEYNRAVTNVDPARVHHVYNYQVPNSRGNRVSYNGGRGGIEARPTPQEQAVVRDPRTPPVGAQVQHAREASTNRAQFATSGGGGHPAALVASRPLPTTYKAPAARPPAAAVRTAAPSATEPPARAQPNERPPTQATRVPESRPAPQQLQRPEARPIPEARPPVPENRTTAQRPTPAPIPENRPAPVTRPEIRPAPPRPAPQARPEPIPTAPPRPAPQARPQAPPREARPAPPPSRPAPQARPEARPPEARPAAPPPPRAAPQARPQPQAKPAAPPPRPQQKPKEEEHK
ncbi:MAG: hypothetical protein ABSG13_06795 [Bryobacteraceae bacterium]